MYIDFYCDHVYISPLAVSHHRLCWSQSAISSANESLSFLVQYSAVPVAPKERTLHGGSGGIRQSTIRTVASLAKMRGQDGDGQLYIAAPNSARNP